MITLPAQIESYLFFSGEPVSLKKLAQVFNVTKETLDESLLQLQAQLEGRGIVLMRLDDQVTLATHPDMGAMIQSIRKQELSDPLSKGALETLTIILYKGKATKPEIDFIRGVNSGFMLRNLLVRGLIEKIPHETDKRTTVYRSTLDTLQFLGITSLTELPHYDTFREEFEKRENQSATETSVFTSDSENS